MALNCFRQRYVSLSIVLSAKGLTSDTDEMSSAPETY
jgi:hypothetical protein